MVSKLEMILAVALAVSLVLVGVSYWPEGEEEPNGLYIDDVEASRGGFTHRVSELYINVTLTNGREWPYELNGWDVQVTAYENDRLLGERVHGPRGELLPGDSMTLSLGTDVSDDISLPNDLRTKLVIFVVLRNYDDTPYVMDWEVLVVQGADNGGE